MLVALTPIALLLKCSTASLVQNNEFIWAQPSGNVLATLGTAFLCMVGGVVWRKVVDAFLMIDGHDIKNSRSDFPYESDITQSVSNQKVMGPVIHPHWGA